VDVLSIVVGASALLGGAGGVGTVAYFREVRNSRKKQDDIEHVKTRIAAAIVPVQAEIASLHIKLDNVPEQRHAELKAALHEAMEPVRDQLAVLNTKVEPLWTALINMGINQTNVLHQPDPLRAEVDRLLELLQDELRGGQRMKANDYLKLRRTLEQIKEWEPGQDLGFPVLPAEPTSAAVLLAIMGLSRVRRK
jgi:hypothetical protein